LNDNVHIKKIKNFFNKYVPNEFFQTNWHLIILDGLGSHVNLEAIKQSHQFGLDMITLPSHTSRALQPFNVSSNFKAFKTWFKKEIDSVVVIEKIMLIG
jgi:hypothetical protein